MSFDLNSFVACPSLAQLEKCKNKDLEEIVSCYEICIAKQLKKSELKALLIGELVGRGVLATVEVSELDDALAEGPSDPQAKE